jgi:dTDP-4-amino-4,6-dideoxygalactose transaminase
MEAIEPSLRPLEIGSEDEVITTPMTAIATVVAIMHTGATSRTSTRNRAT